MTSVLSHGVSGGLGNDHYLRQQVRQDISGRVGGNIAGRVSNSENSFTPTAHNSPIGDRRHAHQGEKTPFRRVARLPHENHSGHPADTKRVYQVSSRAIGRTRLPPRKRDSGMSSVLL